jgi:hypothetical protein
VITQQEIEDDLAADVALAVRRFKQCFGVNATLVMLDDLRAEIAKVRG